MRVSVSGESTVLGFIHFFFCFGLTEPPMPQEIPIPSVGGGVRIFSGTTHENKSELFYFILIFYLSFYCNCFYFLLFLL